MSAAKALVLDLRPASGRVLPELRLSLFGRMRAETRGGCILPRSRKARALLAILALSPNRPVLRSHVTALLWSLRDKRQAQASLRQAVHELQHALPGTISSDRNHLVLLGRRLAVDALAFQTATPTRPEPLGLYAPPLLADLRGLDPAFDGWLTEQERQLARIACTIGEAVLAVQHDPAGTLRAAEHLLGIDPAHEAAWRAAIGVHLERNDYPAARAAYDRCEASLAQAGRPAPSAATLAMADAVGALGARLSELPRRLARGPRPPARDAARRVRLGVIAYRRIEADQTGALAAALAQEITIALAQFRWIDCIATIAVPESAGPGDILRRPPPGADFLLDGTIQCDGGRVRIIARLSDMRMGATVLWARRFDRTLADVFALQDEIAAETVAQMDAALLLWEGERAALRRGEDTDAQDLLLQAIPRVCRFDQELFRGAGGLLEGSLQRDPTNAVAHAWLAHWHLFLVGQGWAPNPAAAINRAAGLAERALHLDGRDARAMTLAGHVHGFLTRRPEEARLLHDRALALNPNLALAWCFSGLAHSYLGNHAEATRRMHHALKLSPQDPHEFFFDTAQIMPHLLLREFEAAAAIGRRASALNPGFSSSLKGQLSALGHLGLDREAADVRTRLLAIEPSFSVRSATERSPMMRDEDIELYADGLRRAGLPE